jgi:hypothetical protein
VVIQVPIEVGVPATFRTVYGDADPPHVRRRRFVLVAFEVVAVGSLNLFKPVHIDDALYLAIAEHIMVKPFDPYGFDFNWQHTTRPAYEVSISPPLLSYWHALWMKLGFGDGPALHLMMLPWLALLGWCLLSLFGRVSEHAGLATAALILSPSVFAGSNLMLDVPMTACLTAGFECLLRSEERRSRLWLVMSALAGAAAVLIKYPAAVFVPLCLTFAITARTWRPLIPALACSAAFLAWQWWSRHLYGAGQVQQAASFLEKFQGEAGVKTLQRFIQMLVIFGATFALWIPALCSGRRRFAAFLLATIFTMIGGYLLRRTGAWNVDAWKTAGFLIALFLGAFAASEIVVGAFRRTAETPALRWTGLIWAAGIVGLTITSAPFVAGRYLLPALPAMLLLHLVCRRPTRGGLIALLVASGGIGFAVAVVDLRWAAFYPTTVQKFKERSPDTASYFAGHWGLQWYAEKAGMKPWEQTTVDAPSGTRVIVPRRAVPTPILPPIRFRMKLIDERVLPVSRWKLAIWRRAPPSEIGLCFHGWEFPHLPWGFRSDEDERIGLFEIQ